MKQEIASLLLIFFGSILFLLTYIINSKNPEPNGILKTMVEIFMSIGAACFAGAIPGFIEVDGGQGNIRFKAGGALAIFLIVYFRNKVKISFN